jgi:hypothetical protein
VPVFTTHYVDDRGRTVLWIGVDDRDVASLRGGSPWHLIDPNPKPKPDWPKGEQQPGPGIDVVIVAWARTEREVLEMLPKTIHRLTREEWEARFGPAEDALKESSED